MIGCDDVGPSELSENPVTVHRFEGVHSDYCCTAADIMERLFKRRVGSMEVDC